MILFNNMINSFLKKYKVKINNHLSKNNFQWNIVEE